MRWRYGDASANVSRSCWTTQTDDGCEVTLTWRILRRPCSMTNKQYRTRKVTVGTVKKSRATIASRWLRTKASHLLAGSPRRWIGRKYRATVLSESTKPSFCNSPWIFGAPIGVLLCQTPNQDPNRFADPRPAATRPRCPTPIQSETGPVPGDDRLRLSDQQRICPPRPSLSQEHPEEPINRAQRRPGPPPLQDSHSADEGRGLRKQRQCGFARKPERR